MHDQRGSIGWVATFALLITIVIGFISVWVGWLIAGGITLAVGAAVAVCVMLLAATCYALAKSGVLTVAAHPPRWLDRLDRSARDVPKMSDAVERALMLAVEEARHFHCDRVGTEHLLLGLMREHGHAAHALTRCEVSLEALIHATDLIGGGGSFAGDTIPTLGIAASRILDDAGICARDERARLVQTRHLLVALIADQHGTAAMILEHLGCTRATITAALRATRERAER